MYGFNIEKFLFFVMYKVCEIYFFCCVEDIDLRFVIGLVVKFYFIELVIEWIVCDVNFICVVEFDDGWLKYCVVIGDYG